MQGGKDHKERKDIERHKHGKGKGREKNEETEEYGVDYD